MALFFECMLQCARKVLDTADIVRDVRDAWLQQLSKWSLSRGPKFACQLTPKG